MTRLTGQGVQVNKAIVGRNAFAHEAGIHQDGRSSRTGEFYEIMRAEDVGAPWNPLVLGKHRGRHVAQKRCTDLGLQAAGNDPVEIYRALMDIADERKIITDNDILAVVSSVKTGYNQAGIFRARGSIRHAVSKRPRCAARIRIRTRSLTGSAV